MAAPEALLASKLHPENKHDVAKCCRVILSWFPAFDWERTIWRELRQVTDPYLNIFTGIVPPLLGAIDLTPLLGFFVLQALKGYLTVYTDDDIEAWW